MEIFEEFLGAIGDIFNPEYVILDNISIIGIQIKIYHKIKRERI